MWERASICPSRRPGSEADPRDRMQPERELRESERKEMKGNEREIAFFCFLLLFGIGAFQ
jgi:hypothetical protein